MNINEGVDRILTRVSIDLMFFSSLDLMLSRWVFFLLEFSSYAVRTVSWGHFSSTLKTARYDWRVYCAMNDQAWLTSYLHPK